MTLVLLALVSFLAGALNAVAGGGAFITFPALVFLGVPPVSANATSAAALFPGQLASALAYGKEGLRDADTAAYSLMGVSLAGGVLGALCLVFAPSSFFSRLVPWLMLFATLLFLIGNFSFGASRRPKRSGSRGVLLAQLLISIYGGYFGAGIGFLMLASLTLFGMRDIHAMNGLRVILAPLMKLTAIIIFIAAGVVRWPDAVVMATTSAVGGYAGAVWAKQANPRLIKALIVLLGASLTVVFFLHPV